MSASKPKTGKLSARTRSASEKDTRNASTVVVRLRKLATKAQRDSLARYGIPADHAIGVTVADLHRVAKEVGRSHDLALALWKTGIYEARMLSAFVDEPAKVTPAQMDRCAGDFDNWAICDTLCFHLFDRTPHVFAKVRQWEKNDAEFVKRAAFALLASVALHDKKAPHEPFLEFLPAIERAATDERNFVKKGVLWALRGIGGRSVALHAAAHECARELAESKSTSARWIGKSALRELSSPASQKRLGKQREREAKA